MSNADRLEQRLKRARRPIPMPTLRREFPGGFTQRVSDLRKRGRTVECVKVRVKGKLHTAYLLVA